MIIAAQPRRVWRTQPPRKPCSRTRSSLTDEEAVRSLTSAAAHAAPADGAQADATQADAVGADEPAPHELMRQRRSNSTRRAPTESRLSHVQLTTSRQRSPPRALSAAHRRLRPTLYELMNRRRSYAPALHAPLGQHVAREVVRASSPTS